MVHNILFIHTETVTHDDDGVYVTLHYFKIAYIICAATFIVDCVSR